MTPYQECMSVMNFLKKLGVSMINIGDAIQDSNWEKTCRLIKENPEITKKEFLKEMQIEEED